MIHSITIYVFSAACGNSDVRELLLLCLKMDIQLLEVEKLDISDVRKSLYEIRERYKNKDTTPIYLSENLSNRSSIEQFCHKFSLASHLRRHRKSNAFKNAVQSKTDDD